MPTKNQLPEGRPHEVLATEDDFREGYRFAVDALQFGAMQVDRPGLRAAILFIMLEVAAKSRSKRGDDHSRN